MTKQRDLTFRQMVDLSFGFLGVQIAYALQSANISRIFATLGADPHQLSWFWILPPLMGGEDAADIRALQRVCDLDPEEAEAEVHHLTE